MTDLEPESTLVFGVNASVGRDRQAFKDRLSAVGSAILEDGLLEGSHPEVGFYELARLFQYYTLQVSMAKEPRTATRGNPHGGGRAGKAADHQRRDRRDWKPLKMRYDELCRLLPSTPLATVDVPRLRQFCDCESLRHGARDPSFYATLLVLAAHMEERGDFRGERFERAVPICERDLRVRIRRLVEERLLVPFAFAPHGGRAGMQAVPPSRADETEGRVSALADPMPGQQADRAPSVYLRVAYRSADSDRFDEFVGSDERSKTGSSQTSSAKHLTTKREALEFYGAPNRLWVST